MATVRRLREVPIEADGLGSSLSRLARLELELGLAEARAVITQLAIAIAVAVTAAIAFVAALVGLVAAAFAPLFGAGWQHLVIAGGGVALLSLALTASLARAGATVAGTIAALGGMAATVEHLRETPRRLRAA